MPDLGDRLPIAASRARKEPGLAQVVHGPVLAPVLVPVLVPVLAPVLAPARTRTATITDEVGVGIGDPSDRLSVRGMCAAIAHAGADPDLRSSNLAVPTWQSQLGSP